MNDKEHVTNHELALELKNLRSEVRLWILAAVGLNAFLANVTLPDEVTAVAIGAAIAAPIVKGVVAYLGVR